jgi:DNA-binding protein H-NS
MSIPPAFDTAFFNPFTTPQLRALLSATEVELHRRLAADKAAAISQILAIAQAVDLPLSELVAKHAKPATKVPPQFRNPDDASQQWTGRGRAPGWVNEAQARGVSLDTMRIQSVPDEAAA